MTTAKSGAYCRVYYSLLAICYFEVSECRRAASSAKRCASARAQGSGRRVLRRCRLMHDMNDLEHMCHSAPASGQFRAVSSSLTAGPNFPAAAGPPLDVLSVGKLCGTSSRSQLLDPRDCESQQYKLVCLWRTWMAWRQGVLPLPKSKLPATRAMCRNNCRYFFRSCSKPSSLPVEPPTPLLPTLHTSVSRSSSGVSSTRALLRGTQSRRIALRELTELDC